MIKTLIFDMGGVIFTLDPNEGKRRFSALGVPDVDRLMDAYTQTGVFGHLEEGKISQEEFRATLSNLAGHEISHEECKHAWLGYSREVPMRNIELLRQLRKEGYRLVLLSNTNAYMTSWVLSPDFSGDGHPLSDFFDALYFSFEVGALKPSERFFNHVIEHEQLNPEEALFIDDGPRNVEAAARLGLHTYCPENGSDWASKLHDVIREAEQ